MAVQAQNFRRIGGLLAGFLLAGLALTLTLAAPASAGHHSAKGDDKGTTAGWLDGDEVTFIYPKAGFCDRSVEAGSDSGCELGEEAATAARPGNVPVLYVMTPLGFRPDDATLQCPEVGACINHPSTIDLSRVFGAGTENAPLPAHSHIVDKAAGGWWELEVVGVTDEDVWDEVVAGKSLDRVRELQDEGVGITGDIPTNAFLFFNVTR